MKRSCLILAITLLSFTGICGQPFKPFPLFQDNMVIQRQKPVHVYGTAAAGILVTVDFNGKKGESVTGKDGHWDVILPALEAGGPYEMKISEGDESLTYKNIMIGDVWIASGQSNMEYRMKQGVPGYKNEVALADFPGIRYYEVPQRPASVPHTDLPESEWKICTPENVPEFSAVAFYFAQKINRETGIPIGIINVCWGGSSVEAWMSPAAYAGLPHQAGPDLIAAMGDLSLEEFHVINEENTKTVVDVTSNSFEGLKKGVETAGYNDSNWPVLKVPEWGKVDNQVFWFRKQFFLDRNQKDSLKLSLGVAGSIISVYINGKEVFRGNGVQVEVSLPAGTFHKGSNIIAFRLANPWWYPYILNGENGLALRDAPGNILSDLSGEWKYNMSIEPHVPKFFPLQTVPSALYNGMLYPLFSTPVAGFIWYQGETNGDQGVEYRKLFTSMICEWRIKFRQGYLPFYFVQLANLGDPSEMVEDHGWPFLREAQDMALYLPYTGMATAIDVGNRYDIHPKDKKTVGYRLALNALNTTYHLPVSFSGPHFSSAEFNEGSVILHFDNAKGLHTNDDSSPASFCIAGADRQFHPATARINGDIVELKCTVVSQPVAVRYAWAKNPVINLFNDADLPTLPFRTDDWPPK